MNGRERKTILHALASAQASIDLALSLLMGESKPETCQHPEERRQDLRGMGGGAEHFYCTVCRTEVDMRGEEAGSGDGGGDADEIPGPGWPELPD